MREDPYANNGTTRTPRATSKRNGGSKTAPASAPQQRSGKIVNFFGDNPPVRLVIVYANGDEDILKGNQIDADNPIIKALCNIRTIRRFWTDSAMPADKQTWSTDEEVLEAARQLGIALPDGSTAERAAAAASRLGLSYKFFQTGEDGEPLHDERGFWLEASVNNAGTYTPGTHVTA